jgi:HK97 family phage major capsid protein
VLEQYRTGAEWYMNRVGLGLCLNILDLQNRPIFFIGMNDGNSNVGMTMLGSKVDLSSQIGSAYGVGLDETNIIYGNYKYVLLGEKAGANGIQVAVSNSAVSGVGAQGYVGQNAFMQDETWYRFVLRRSVIVAVEEAFSVLKMVK